MNTENVSRETKGDAASRGVMTAAVFDVDRTLVPVTTTERIFIRYLLRKRVLGLGAVVRTGLFVVRNMTRASPFEAIRRQRAYLAGQDYEKMERLARRCFESDIRPRLSPVGLEALREHREQGHSVVLLSGSLDFLLEPLKEYLEAEHLIAAKMEVVRGRLTGGIVGNFPYGGYKAELIRHFGEEHGLDFEKSYAYADHHTDHEVLKLFGSPVVVNPKAKMKVIAEREGWDVRNFEL